MSSQRVTPEWVAAQTTTAHGGQVGGHPGSLQLLVGPNGESLVVKESLASEAAFYEDLYEPGLLPGESEEAAERRKELRERWAPTYYGSLPLPSGSPDPSKQGGAAPDAPTSSSVAAKGRIIVSDLLSGFKRPCMMDVKLGTQLWDESATEEKRIRMDKQSKETTSWTTGLRITGWRIWNPDNQSYITFSKVFGKKASVPTLNAAINSFFDAFGPTDLAAFDDLLEVIGESEEVREQHRSFGGLSADFQDQIVSVVESHILPQVHQLRALLSSLEMRMRGGSVLIIYEGDEEEFSKRYAALSAEAETKDSTPPPVAVHLIDFAHAKFRHADHAGPDDGVIMGLDMLIHLLHGRLDHDWESKHKQWVPTRGAAAPPSGPKTGTEP